jgi:hypothetical protein
MRIRKLEAGDWFLDAGCWMLLNSLLRLEFKLKPFTPDWELRAGDWSLVMNHRIKESLDSRLLETRLKPLD